jgi:GT2 family glycosyltransferase
MVGNDKRNMDLSIIIVSWNVKKKLRENLGAIYESPTPSASPPQAGGEKNVEKGKIDFEVFVVDNNSADGSAEMVEKEFPQVKLINNKDNLGFAKANNQGIEIAKGRYILLLNPDMKIFPDTFSNMVKWMDENTQAIVAGCHLISENGETVKHVRRFPTIWDQLAITLKLPHLFPKLLDKYLGVDFDYSKPAKVDSVRGGFFMIRTNPSPTLPFPACLCGTGYRGGENQSLPFTKGETKEGGFTLPLLDERFFIWFEEVDYCKQVKELGGEVWYTPTAKCIDYVGQSFKQVKRGTTQDYFKESMLKYFKKWHPWWQYLFIWTGWLLISLVTWIPDALNIKSRAKT